MRVAVVGTGFARQVHLPGYAMVDGVELAAVCDNRPGRARQVAEEFGADRSCEDFADVLSMADVDVVDICTPPTLHAPMAVSALSAGKAVICEKPMSSDLESASRMAAAAAGWDCQPRFISSRGTSRITGSSGRSSLTATSARYASCW